MRIALRRSDGARVIQLPSGCMPMISECACWAIWRTRVLRYFSGIQSRGSIRLLAAIVRSKEASSSGSASASVIGVLQDGSGRFTDRSVSNSLARVHGFAQRKVHPMSALLESYVAGRWFSAHDEGQPLLDAATGEEVARVSATGVDLGAMTDYARGVGGPSIRALTFHERAGLLKAVAKRLTEVKDELYALSYRTGATKRDSMVDIDGGIGTVFSIAGKGTRELPKPTPTLDGRSH